MPDSFERGAVVRAKPGPALVVEKDLGDGTVQCCRFAGLELMRERYLIATLERTEAPKPGSPDWDPEWSLAADPDHTPETGQPTCPESH